MKIKTIQLIKITPTHKINDKAKENYNITLQNELTTLKEACEDQKTEHESEIQNQATDMNKRHQEKMKQHLI